MSPQFEKLIPFAPRSDIEAFHQSYLLIVACYLTALFSAAYFALHAFVGFEIGAVTLGLVTVAFAVLPPLFRKTGATEIIANAFVLVGLIAIAIPAYFSGGVVITPWFAAIPLVGVLLTGGRGGGAWLLVSILVIVGFTTLQQSGYAFPNHVNPERQALFDAVVRVGLPAIIFMLALVFQTEKNRAFSKWRLQNETLRSALDELKQTQEQLVQQAKLASLGQLTAGVAHEIKNPLNFVNNFAVLSRELVRELRGELESGGHSEHVNEILEDLQANASRIEEHGRRADSIVRTMMAHTRDGQSLREPVNINQLVEEHVALAYQSQRAEISDFDVNLQESYDDEIGDVKVVPGEIGRVLLNLVDNAFDAARAAKQHRNGSYEPRVWVETRQFVGCTEIRVSDNGIGIPEDKQKKIFEPFYTTKPPGEGIGLGLSLSYDIVNGRHHGTLSVDSEEGKGTTFVVALPNPSL